jgi:hypothetical protein
MRTLQCIIDRRIADAVEDFNRCSNAKIELVFKSENVSKKDAMTLHVVTPSEYELSQSLQLAHDCGFMKIAVHR